MARSVLRFSKRMLHAISASSHGASIPRRVIYGEVGWTADLQSFSGDWSFSSAYSKPHHANELLIRISIW